MLFHMFGYTKFNFLVGCITSFDHSVQLSIQTDDIQAGRSEYVANAYRFGGLKMIFESTTSLKGYNYFCTVLGSILDMQVS